jgi:hypothetical protein
MSNMTRIPTGAVPYPDDTDIQALPLGGRPKIRLKFLGIKTVGELRRVKDDVLLGAENFGVSSLHQVRMLVPYSPHGMLTYGELVRENVRLRERVRALEKRLADIAKLGAAIAKISRSA